MSQTVTDDNGDHGTTRRETLSHVDVSCHDVLMTIAMTGAVPTVTLAHRLRIAREYAGLEQGELAERAEISRASVVNYEMGHRAPRRLYLRAIAEATGVDLTWLETGTAPAEAEAVAELSQHSVRPKGLEPLTFWFGVSGDVGPSCYGLAA